MFISSKQNRVPFFQKSGPTRKERTRQDSRCPFVAHGNGSVGISTSTSFAFQLHPLPRRDFVSRGSLPNGRAATVPSHDFSTPLRHLQAAPPHSVLQAKASSRQRFLVRGRCGRCNAPLLPADEAAQTPAVLGARRRLDGRQTASGLCHDAACVGRLESCAQDDDALVADPDFLVGTASSLVVEEERRLAQVVVTEGLVLFDDDLEAVACGADQLLDSCTQAPECECAQQTELEPGPEVSNRIHPGELGHKEIPAD